MLSRILPVAAAGVLLLGGACAENSADAADTLTSDAWVVDYDKSRLGFAATQTNQTFEGAFQSFEAEIIFDPDNLDAASINVSIDMKSAKTGDRQRDSAIPGSDWFDAKNHPQARFVSNDIVSVGEDAYEARGQLSIRDASKDVVLPFTLSIVDGQAVAKGGFTLMRTDYGVGAGEFSTDEWVGLDVAVSVDISAKQP